MAIEIADVPMKQMVSIQSFLYVYQKVSEYKLISWSGHWSEH